MMKVHNKVVNRNQIAAQFFVFVRCAYTTKPRNLVPVTTALVRQAKLVAPCEVKVLAE
jgi:hypothetical protein